MDYEFKDCMDAGSEYCPCHLAEAGECIICSQLSGKTFCDCINWKGVCIFQEYYLNGNKAKDTRKNITGKIIEKELLEDTLILFTIKVPHNFACEVLPVGSFVFLRTPDTEWYYDAPISVMEADTEENTIKLAIEKRGIKTKTLFNKNIGEELAIKGPFWNGVLGKKNILSAKDGTSIVIARGIGIAPGIPVIKKLKSNGNKVIVILDSAPFKEPFAAEYLIKYNTEIKKCSAIKNGVLTEDIKDTISEILKNEPVNLIHCDGPDILIHQLLNFLDPNIKISCCNNSKMCCGEGVCGSCSTRYEGHKVKRLCKVQLDPKYVFKGRRLI